MASAGLEAALADAALAKQGQRESEAGLRAAQTEGADLQAHLLQV